MNIDLEMPGFVTFRGALAMLGGIVTPFALRQRTRRGIAAGTIAATKYDGGKIYLPVAVVEDWRLHPPKRGRPKGTATTTAMASTTATPTAQ